MSKIQLTIYPTNPLSLSGIRAVEIDGVWKHFEEIKGEEKARKISNNTFIQKQKNGVKVLAPLGTTL